MEPKHVAGKEVRLGGTYDAPGFFYVGTALFLMLVARLGYHPDWRKIIR